MGICAQIRPGFDDEHQNSIAQLHGFFDVVRHQQHRPQWQLVADPQIEEVGAQRLGRENVERGEGLIHEKRDRIRDDRTGKPHPLAHAAGQLAWIGRLKAVETDEVDCGRGAMTRLGAPQPKRVQACLDVPLDAEPGVKSEALEYNADSGRRPAQRRAAIEHFTGGGLDEAGGDAQQRRFSGARASQEAQDLPFAQGGVDLGEHDEGLTRRLLEGVAHPPELDDRILG